MSESAPKTCNDRMNFKVIRVIDGITIEIEPEWEFRKQKGRIVRQIMFDFPKRSRSGASESRRRLDRLLLGKEIELKNPLTVQGDRLICDVYFPGQKSALFCPPAGLDLRHQR